MATTHDYTFDSDTPNKGAGVGKPWGGVPVNVSKIHIDMPAAKTALGATIDGSSSDVMQIWDIPYPCWILACWVHVTTKEDAACTIAIGTGDSAAGFMVATSIAATGWLVPAITDAYMATNGIFYNSADTLDLTFATDSDVSKAVFDVYVAWIDCDYD